MEVVRRSETTVTSYRLHDNTSHKAPIITLLYCTVFLFSPNIIHMIADSSVCNKF